MLGNHLIVDAAYTKRMTMNMSDFSEEPLNQSCTHCGNDCVNKRDWNASVDEYGKWDSEIFLFLIIVGVIGFALGAAITGTIMIFTFRGNSKRGKSPRKRRPKVAPETKTERSDSLVVDELMKEATIAQKSYDKEQERRKSAAGASINSRLAIRKAQLELKVQASKSLEKVPLFKDLDSSQMSTLIKAMKLKVFDDGSTICNEGDRANNFFVVASVESEDGCVLVRGRKNDTEESHEPQAEVELKRLKEFAYMGEAALVEGRLRSASCYAVGRVEMLSLTRRQWNQLVKDGVVSSEITNDLAEKALEHSKEAEVRKGATVEVADAPDLQETNGNNETEDGEIVEDGGEEELTFDLTAEDGVATADY